MEPPLTTKPLFQIIKGGRPDNDPELNYNSYMCNYLYSTPLNGTSIYPRATPWSEIVGKDLLHSMVFGEGRDSLQLLLNNSKIPVFVNHKYFGHIAMMERCTFTKDTGGQLLVPTPSLKTYTLFSEIDNEAYGADLVQLTKDMRSTTLKTEYSLLYDHLVCNLTVEREEESDE